MGAAKWLRNQMQHERLHNFLGGQFKRMIGFVKQAFNKSVGNLSITWSELQDVLLDVEVALNNRPLSYVEEHAQLPVLTPNILQFGRPNLLPEDDNQENHDLRKRLRYLAKCKDEVWGRWSTEYLKAFVKDNLKHNKQRQLSLSRGDFTREQPQALELGIVAELISGRDGFVRGAKLRAGKSYLERPIQHLYPLKLPCDMTAGAPIRNLNP